MLPAAAPAAGPVLPANPSDAPAVAGRAARILGLEDVTVARVGMCVALFATSAGRPVFVRVHQSGVDTRAASRAASRARAAGVRAPELLGGPFDLAGQQAWLWERLDPVVAALDHAVIGSQVALLHSAVAAEDLENRDVVTHRLRVLDTRLRAYRAAGRVDASTDAVLRAAAGAAQEKAARRAWGAVAACHGDLKPSNVVPTAGGPYLVDWDSAFLGDTAWDVACWALAASACAPNVEAGRDAAREFLTAYESAAGSCPAADVIAAFAELKALSVLTFLLGRDDRASQLEAATRLRHWTHGCPASGWTDL